MKRTALALFSGLLLAHSVYAQAPAAAPATPKTEDEVIDEMVAAGKAAATAKVPHPFHTTFGFQRNQLVAMYFVALNKDRVEYAALVKALEARASKQITASPPSSKASTSLATKGLVPQILGAAVETGAVSRDVTGTVLTFRATPAGVVKALQGEGLGDILQGYDRSPAWKVASRFSVAASFDTSKGAGAGSFTGQRDQLTSWGVHVEIVNHRDPASVVNAPQWRALLARGAGYNATVMQLYTAFDAWPEFVAWQKKLAEQTDTIEQGLDAASSPDAVPQASAKFKALLQAEMPKLKALPHQPAEFVTALNGYVAALTKEQAAIDDTYDFIGKGTLVTFDWTTTRKADLPDLYAATAVWETALGASRKTDFTFNAAWNFYRSVPANATHQLKSFDVTAQLDHPLGKVLSLPTITATVAGKYSRLPNDTVTTTPDAGVAAAPLGNIYFIQGKLTVPVSGSMKVPISVTASNRTELIKEKTVRATVGFTIDFDTLTGLLPGVK